MRVVSGNPREKEWSTPAAPTVGHSHPLLPDSALLSSVLTATVASMFSMLIFKTISRVRTRLIAGLLRPWTATWESYWNLAVLWDRPHVCTHWTSSKAFDSVRHSSIAVDRGGRREFECYLNLLMVDFWYSTVPHIRTLKKVMDSVRMPSTVDGVWTHCERVRRRQWERCINLGLLTVTYGRAFWGRISYRIVSRYFVQYRIVSIVFPHDLIVPSLLKCSVKVTFRVTWDHWHSCHSATLIYQKFKRSRDYEHTLPVFGANVSVICVSCIVSQTIYNLARFVDLFFSNLDFQHC